MQEVTIRLRFNRACLGYAIKPYGKRGQVIYTMPRDPRGRVMFLTSWWRGRFRYASEVANRCQGLVDRIAWDPLVDGVLSQHKRIVVAARDDRKKRARYALHEAFLPGTTIAINAVIPHGMTTEDFSELLSLVGTYKGISPFQSEDESWGTFEIVSVSPVPRREPEPNEAAQPALAKE